MEEKFTKVREDLSSLEDAKDIKVYVARSGPNSAMIVVPEHVDIGEVGALLLKKGYTVQQPSDTHFSITW